MRYPSNITIQAIEVANLFDESTQVSISVLSDADEGKQKFKKMVTDMNVEKGKEYDLDIDIQCFDTFVVKLETSEGFHTKISHCNQYAKVDSTA